MSDENKEIHHLDNQVLQALDKCAEALSLQELSRMTGVQMELLLRTVNRQVRHVRAETWDKIAPALKPYLEGPEPPQEPPPRIGPAYRRQPELVEMFSGQKVLLDEFDVFAEAEQEKIIQNFSEMLKSDAAPSEYSNLTDLENRVMGIYLAMDPAMQDEALSFLTKRAKEEVRRRRKELF